MCTNYAIQEAVDDLHHHYSVIREKINNITDLKKYSFKRKFPKNSY